MPKDKSEKGETARKGPSEQTIPEEVLKQLPPDVKAQLGYVEEQKPIFKPPSGVNAGLSDSIDRLREGFEKIGLTLIGRMGEFASTLERVVMTVARIEKVENLTAETTYFLKNLQKTLDGFTRNFNKIVDQIDNIEINIEQMSKEIEDLKKIASSGQIIPIPPQPIATPATIIPEISTNRPLATPSEPSPPTQKPAPPAAKDPIDILFIDLQDQIKVGANTKKIADILDHARETISAASKWIPEIYQIRKLAQKLRKLDTPLSQKESDEIINLLNQCKKQMKQT
ncbi:MAG: hypothetical protein HWN66_09345 [Candidatus Helarchaeota archaeon]|nr:hypothetical protein [Candidatus Helarchaeota archaeon]